MHRPEKAAVVVYKMLQPKEKVFENMGEIHPKKTADTEKTA